MPLLRFQDIADQFPFVDDVDVIEKAKTNQALEHALELCRPRNWRGSGLKPEQILAMATDSAIPVAWLPSTVILQRLVAAQPSDRMFVLMSSQRDTLFQCRELLAECSDEWIQNERTLITQALGAFDGGHHEAAMALAVAVGEPLALWASEPRVKVFMSKEEQSDWERLKRKERYSLARRELATVGSLDQIHPLDVARKALIAPIPRFFVPFYRGDESLPVTVSRHATVHQPTVAHFSRENALLALMLCVSILRDQQEWSREVRMDDAAWDQDHEM